MPDRTSGPAAGGTAEEADPETGGLPRRRRGQTLAAVAAAAAVKQAEKPRAGGDFGARFGAFRSATRSATRGGRPASGEDHSETVEDGE